MGVVSSDRGGPALLSAHPCEQRDAIVLLNESGCLSLRVRRRLYAVASTPVEPIRSMSKSISSSTSSLQQQQHSDNVSESSGAQVPYENVLEVTYEQRALGESVRLSKNARVLALAVNPMTERNFAVITSDGRIILTDVLSSAHVSVSRDTTKRIL